MVPRRRIELAGLMVAVIGAVAWLMPQSTEPVYEGKSVSYWMTHPRLVADTNSGFALSAVTFPVMDTNALPFLVKALEQQDGRLDHYYSNLWARVPAGLQKLAPRPVPAYDVRWAAAIILGDIGRPALAAKPALIRALKMDADAVVRSQAITALSKIGLDDPTVRMALADAANDRDPAVAGDAAALLFGISLEGAANIK
jgi:HEAT repeats